jgi:CheY-like chemotaxis protein
MVKKSIYEELEQRTEELEDESADRKRAEEALRESEGNYRSIMGAMDDAAYICSPGFRVEYMNPAMIKRTGVDFTGDFCYKAVDKAIPEKEEVKPIKGHGRILVMDDQASLREIVGRMLKYLGYESESAMDGAEAIRMYKKAQKSERPYDAVILDLNVPGGMGGKETINKLLEIDPEVKAIVYSGYSEDPVLAKFREYGFKGMMTKPFEFRALGSVLYKVLQGED